VAPREFVVTEGDRIAQGVIAPVVRAELVESAELSETERGANGFGSTGNR
jgi:dUTP pyrophosphatase